MFVLYLNTQGEEIINLVEGVNKFFEFVIEKVWPIKANPQKCGGAKLKGPKVPVPDWGERYLDSQLPAR